MRVPLKHDDGVPKMVLSHVNSCELSEGWINLSLFDICRPKQWKTISAKELTSEGYPVYGANGKIGFYSDYNHERPTILITCRGATCGRINISEQRSYVNGNAMALDDLDENVVLLKFAAYALEFRGLDDTITGSAQPQITRASLERVSLSVPPLAEQRRIVAKLETLLGKVSSSQQRLARIPGLLKRFRQSVLSAATSGRLTSDWRKANIVGETGELNQIRVEEPFSHLVTAPGCWESFTLGECCEFIGGSQPPKSVFVHEDGPALIRLIQIRDYKSDKHVTYIPRKLAKRFCTRQDVMIGRYGPPLFQILRGLEGAYNVALMKAVPKTLKLDLEYLYVFLRRDDLLKYVEAASDRTAGQDGVRKELLNPYPLFLPSLAEQQEIVRRVEKLFAFADRIEARLKQAQSYVDRLTQSILAKAFRGELVPTEAELARREGRSYETASELLDRIRVARSDALTTKPKKQKK